MSSLPSTRARIEAAVAALGDRPLDEDSARRHLAPLFSRHCAAFAGRIYLANHSLGRPLDATEDDLREGLSAWYSGMGDGWDAWSEEGEAHRARYAALLGARRSDAVVPKTSAGQGLRAVLGSYEHPPRVVATRGEFDSLDVILREYARRGLIELRLVEPRSDGTYPRNDLMAALSQPTELLVVSQVMFHTGERLGDLASIVKAAHVAGARVLLDVYHALGVVEVDVAALDADFAVGGAYKYLRGGPGACFLYVAPRLLDAGLRTLDTGWFAKERPFEYARPDPPRFAAGGDGWLESTPPVLTWYQARAGALLALSLGVPRIRARSLEQQALLVDALRGHGIASLGGTEDRGAFVVIRDERATALAEGLAARGIVTDARGPWLRLCPDILTTRAELDEAAHSLAGLLRRRRP